MSSRSAILTIGDYAMLQGRAEGCSASRTCKEFSENCCGFQFACLRTILVEVNLHQIPCCPCSAVIVAWVPAASDVCVISRKSAWPLFSCLFLQESGISVKKKHCTSMYQAKLMLQYYSTAIISWQCRAYDCSKAMLQFSCAYVYCCVMFPDNLGPLLASM